MNRDRVHEETVRKVAKQLGLDADKILEAAYDSPASAELARKLTGQSLRNFRKSNRPKLRGYQLHSGEPLEWAILVFAYSLRAAIVLAWPTMQSFGTDRYIDVSARWLRDCKPSAWGVTEPTVLESPENCDDCELWHDLPPPLSPIDGVARCGDCEALREDDLAAVSLKHLRAGAAVS